jgi:hypothetical protein
MAGIDQDQVRAIVMAGGAERGHLRWGIVPKKQKANSIKLAF